MGTQNRYRDKIVGRGGDYLLALKANRPLLHRDVVAFFDDPPADMLEPSTIPPTAITAASRSVAMSSATRSTGCSQIAAMPTSRAFPIWP